MCVKRNFEIWYHASYLFWHLISESFEIWHCVCELFRFREFHPLFLYFSDFPSLFILQPKTPNCSRRIIYHRLDPIGSTSLSPMRLSPPSPCSLTRHHEQAASVPRQDAAAAAESPRLPPLPSSPCRRRLARSRGGPGGPPTRVSRSLPLVLLGAPALLEIVPHRKGRQYESEL